MTTRELARLVLETLDAQQVYFKQGRHPADLDASRALERKLRKAAMKARDDTPSFFDREAS